MIEKKQFKNYKWYEYKEGSWIGRYIDSLHKELKFAIVIAVIFGVVLGLIKLIQILFTWIK